MYMIHELVNPIYSNEEGTTIDCVITFKDEESGEILEPMPYTANKFDDVKEGADLYQFLVDGHYGNVSKFPEPTIDMLKFKLSEIRQEKQDAGIVVNGLQICTLENSRQEMRHYIDELNETIYWKLKDNNVHPFGPEEFKKVYHAVVKYVNDCFARESNLIAQLEAAEKPSEIDLSQGFPAREITV